MAFARCDDFVVSGPERDLNNLSEAICEKHKAKIRATLGKAVIALGRVVEWRADGICVEADPRRAELILKDIEMETFKGLALLQGE